MSLQTFLNNSTVPFIRYGLGATDNDAVVFQDAGRSGNLLAGTVMSKIAATGKWVPFTDETAVDGSAIPLGVLMGMDILEADIIAGDVVDIPILVGAGVFIDQNQLVFENSLSLATVIGSAVTAPILVQTAKEYLANVGIRVEDTVDITSFENA